MRIDFRLLVALIVCLPTAFVIVLSATGVVRPAEGFCLENGYAHEGDPPSGQESAKSYFVSPELAYTYAAITERFYWPICIRSRRGQHRFWAWGADRDLARLGEPNLRHLHRARVFRILTQTSFSPLAVAFRVEEDGTGGGVLHTAWQTAETERPRVDSGNVQASMDVQEEWLNALPRHMSSRPLSEPEVRALWLLVHRAIPQEMVWRPALDGNWIMIEAIENGRRTVRVVGLDPPPSFSGRLLCALAGRSAIPSSAIAQGLVRNPCGSAAQSPDLPKTTERRPKGAWDGAISGPDPTNAAPIEERFRLPNGE